MKVPTGFVPLTSPEVNPERVPADEFLNTLEADFEKHQCVLYTDRSGVNYFLLEVNGQQFVLPVRTD